MQAIVIQNGIIEIKNIRVKVPAVIKNNQMKNPITCADVTISINEIFNLLKQKYTFYYTAKISSLNIFLLTPPSS